MEPKKLEEGRFEKEERMKIPGMVELSEQPPRSSSWSSRMMERNTVSLNR